MERNWLYVFISQSKQVKRILVFNFGVCVEGCGLPKKEKKRKTKKKRKRKKGPPSPQVSCHKWVLKLHP